MALQLAMASAVCSGAEAACGSLCQPPVHTNERFFRPAGVLRTPIHPTTDLVRNQLKDTAKARGIPEEQARGGQPLGKMGPPLNA